MMQVYAIGYRRNGQYIEELMSEDPTMLLIDTRKVPFSKIKAFAQFDKPALTVTYNKRYRAAGDFLGNLNFKIPNAPIKIAQPEIGIAGLIRYLNEEHNLLLLCGCANYQVCHRKVIVEMLQAKMPDIDVVHTYRLRGVI